jgi:hypothetical protein
MQTQRAGQTAQVSTTKISVQTNERANTQRRGFKQREEESHPPARMFLRRGEKGAARGVDGVAGVLALPARISSTVFHAEEEAKQFAQREDQGGRKRVR